MLTSEEVREIETIMDDPQRKCPREAITYIEALLEDRVKMDQRGGRTATHIEDLAWSQIEGTGGRP